MSKLSDRIRKYVNDFDVSNEYGKWGILNRDQRFMIRRLCDLCDCFESEADYLAAKLQEVRNNKSWISVKDRLPKDRDLVMVWHTGYKTPKKAKYKNDFGFALPIFQLDGDNGLDGEVTHWMPLPEPPKGE